MPMEADFAAQFVAGNIDRESRIKKNSFPIPSTVSGHFQLSLPCINSAVILDVYLRRDVASKEPNFYLYV